jgi:NAD(P)-dependent dehydrogenase (short-subunit alcohol dehydrogenase family)
MTTSTARLAGKAALVTGSTRGLGAAIAKGLAREGAKVAVTGRTQASGDEIVKEIRALGGTAEFVRLDIGVEQSVNGAVARTVELFGGLDILVNNAAPTEHVTGAATDGSPGTKLDGSVEHLTTDALDAIVKPGLYGVVWAIKAALPHLRKSTPSGSIVNISSIASIQGVSDLDAYTITKGAINALTRSVAVNASPQVRSNTIIAGTFVTDGLAPMLGVPELKDAFLETVLTDDLGHPEDIADAVTFLSSDSARYITGVTLPIDGGMSIRMAVPNLDKAAAAMAAAQEKAEV